MSVMKPKNSLNFPGQVLKHQPSDVSPSLRLSLGSAQPQLTMELQKERRSQHRHCPGCGLSAHGSGGSRIPLESRITHAQIPLPNFEILKSLEKVVKV